MTGRRLAELTADGWQLESGEARNAAHPDTFEMPSRSAREHLRVGQGVQLLFQIAAAGDDGGTEAGVERMWAIVAGRIGVLYVGILENQPATLPPGGGLDAGTEFVFRAEHVIAIEDPPREYLIEKYGRRLALEDRRD